MKVSKGKQNLLRMAVAAFLLALLLPMTGLAADKQGRKHNGDFDKRYRKCAKFVNCHDARDGRWDGRGPRRNFHNRSWRSNYGYGSRNRWEPRRDRFNARFDQRNYGRQMRFQQRLNRSLDYRGHQYYQGNQRFDRREINRRNTIRWRRQRG
jgi:hypothetical protein